MKGDTRGRRNARWIERYCIVPDGPRKGEHVRLSDQQYETVCRIYDAGQNPALANDLAPFLLLLHLCGVEATWQAEVRLPLVIDPWTIWAATSPALQAVLRRQGEVIECPELGTRYRAAA